MKRIIITLFLIIPAITFGQSISRKVISSSGNHYEGTTGSISWSVGEIMISTYSSTNAIVTQGFHQADPLDVCALNPVLLTPNSSNITCFGAGDGTVGVTAGGGDGQFSYSWSNGPATATQINLQAGVYDVTVTDGNGCSSFHIFNIIEPDPINVVVGSTDVTTAGANDGTASVTNVTGGDGNYTYSWSNGMSGSSLSNLGPGNYTVTVNDGNNCSSLPATVIINEPAPTVVDISGFALSELGAPINGVRVDLTGSGIDTYNTTADGAYTFSVNAGESYTITPSKDNDVITNNGITTLDLVLIQRHVLNIVLLGSPYKIIAADVNNSSSVTTLDIVLIRTVILQINTSFPPTNRLWSFVNSDYVFPVPENPFPFEDYRTYLNASRRVEGWRFCCTTHNPVQVDVHVEAV